ncbi:galactosylceramide sulfotransferase-like [Mizuhopecten yessoensis]|nr:galactosylceramide sulfotransferase-like [Mizuhopecten yessoensis]
MPPKHAPKVFQVEPIRVKKEKKNITNGIEVRHIAFIKIHKAASSTVQNLFLRYGYEKDLVFALPKSGSTVSIRSSLTPNNVLPPPKNRTYDIFCSHARFNREAFGKVLPNDTTYIGIVREPFQHFQSNLQFYRQKYVVNISGRKPVLEYLLHNDKYMQSGGHIPSTYNRMAYDFGFPDELFWTNDQNEIQKYLLKLDRDVSLVIVTDLFDESIILLRRLLNWDLRHVLYGKLNSKRRSDPRLQLGQVEEELYKNWARIDYIIYNYFLEKLREKIQRQLPDFHEEVAYFKGIRVMYDRFCLSAITDHNGKHDISFPSSAWNKPFVVTREQCKLLHIKGIAFVDKLRAKQRLMSK